MIFRFGAGAFAAAALCVAALAGGSATGARAEAEPQAQIVPPDVETLPSDTPRFVAHEVVQPLPEQDGAAATDARSLVELVAAVGSDLDLSRDVRCLAQAIYFEARGEPLAGQLAVAQVIINRSESHQFPADYCSVVTQRGQFSFVKGGRIPAANEGSAAWSRAVAIAHIAHQDLWESEVGDALFFHATHVRPSWASRKIARGKIDRHVFYR